jgi:hypothetical protein
MERYNSSDFFSLHKVYHLLLQVKKRKPILNYRNLMVKIHGNYESLS